MSNSTNRDDERVTVRTNYGGVYTTTRGAFAAEQRAKREGAASKAAGVEFHDNPHRRGPSSPEDWLYSAWEYGYTHGAEGSVIVEEEERAR